MKEEKITGENASLNKAYDVSDLGSNQGFKGGNNQQKSETDISDESNEDTQSKDESDVDESD